MHRTPLTLSALLFLSFSALAQQTGPMTPPPPESTPKRVVVPPTPPAPPQEQASAEAPITNEAPSKPVEEIIKSFAAHESEFRAERGHYTYTQEFVIQTVDNDSRVDGEYRLKSDIIFTPDGKRLPEKVVSAPPSTLTRIMLSPEDLKDLENVQPFVLTTEELPKYDVKYVGRQQVDELGTYVFDVGPKQIEKNQRYFRGRIWVDDKDLEIVRSLGKAVPDFVWKNNRNYQKGANEVIVVKDQLKENLFPRFETIRENIEGHYWFPTYTRSDDTFAYSSGVVQIRMSVRYSNYKRFGATIKIGKATEIPEKKKQ